MMHQDYPQRPSESLEFWGKVQDGWENIPKDKFDKFDKLIVSLSRHTDVVIREI